VEVRVIVQTLFKSERCYDRASKKVLSLCVENIGSQMAEAIFNNLADAKAS